MINSEDVAWLIVGVVFLLYCGKDNSGGDK